VSDVRYFDLANVDDVAAAQNRPGFRNPALVNVDSQENVKMGESGFVIFENPDVVEGLPVFTLEVGSKFCKHFVDIAGRIFPAQLRPVQRQGQEDRKAMLLRQFPNRLSVTPRFPRTADHTIPALAANGKEFVFAGLVGLYAMNRKLPAIVIHALGSVAINL
jgi:hypothetical protein